MASNKISSIRLQHAGACLGLVRSTRVRGVARPSAASVSAATAAMVERGAVPPLALRSYVTSFAEMRDSSSRLGLLILPVQPVSGCVSLVLFFLK